MNRVLRIVSGIIIAGCFMTENIHARQMYAAGKFYPGDRNELAAYVDDALKKNNVRNLSGIVAVVAPHAGYVFSGRLAAQAISPVNQSYDLVVIMSTGHTHAVKGAALLVNDDYETPLGVVPTDRELATRLMIREPLFEDYPEAHTQEHGIEVELPFLQRRLKKPFKLLAMTLNYAGPAAVKRMAEALATEIKDRKVLLIISTDLSHYTDAENAEYSDRAFAESIKSMDSEFIQETSRLIMGKKIRGLQTVACGETALMLGLETAKLLGAHSFRLGEVTNSYKEYPSAGARERVVGYMNGWFIKSGEPPQIRIQKKDREFLLKEARKAIRDVFDKKDTATVVKNPVLNLPGAVFVTLTIDGNLRGCIGTLQPQMPLSDAVRYGAVSAAFRDHRFAPLQASELDRVKIEISVLSRMKKTDEKDIQPGRHGVVVMREGRSGVFLPQVWKQIPDKDSFMGEVCQQKAGLPRDCWKTPGTDIYTFTVDSFEETERGIKNTSVKGEKKEKPGAADNSVGGNSNSGRKSSDSIKNAGVSQHKKGKTAESPRLKPQKGHPWDSLEKDRKKKEK